jgi:4,5-DOPA dioxygenase extradiol
MFPAADIPVVELSLNYKEPAQYHYDVAKQLLPLREEGVLIIGSGNMVHNLGMVALNSDNFNESFGFYWALEANDTFKKLIAEDKYQKLIDYRSLGSAVRMAVPTPEHYLPVLYAIALRQEDETVSFFNDKPVAGSISMTSFIIDRAD